MIIFLISLRVMFNVGSRRIHTDKQNTIRNIIFKIIDFYVGNTT